MTLPDIASPTPVAAPPAAAGAPAKLVTDADWDTTWAQIFQKYQNDTRHAYYVRAMLRPGEKRILEIAAGSFRDVAALSRWGVRCEGSDFSSGSVELARREFPAIAERLHQWDGFRFPVADGAFDLTYHNGFWVLFSDADIARLAAEQARITKGRMIATVHNAHNAQFKAYFERMRETDPLYNIRFFHADEMREIMGRVCRKVTVVPVGKAKKKYEDTLIKYGLGHPRLLSACFAASGERFLGQSERLLCIGEM